MDLAKTTNIRDSTRQSKIPKRNNEKVKNWLQVELYLKD